MASLVQHPFRLSGSRALLLSLLSIVLLLSLALFTVQETQRGIVLRLGKMVMDEGHPRVYGPGLNVKWPLVDTLLLFDNRLQTIIISSSRIMTKEKKDVIVDLFVKWRIQNVALFYTKTGGFFTRAETLLKQRIIDGVRAEFGKRTIREVVSGERADIMQRLLKEAIEGATDLGIEVVDTRIKRIDLPEEVSGSVYSRMRSERQRIAEEHRAMGQAKADVTRAKADAAVTVLLAEAQEAAMIVKGKGEATAAEIAAKVYSKDPEFYRLYKSLETYKESFKPQDVFLLRPDGKGFFQYFKNPDMKGAPADPGH